MIRKLVLITIVLLSLSCAGLNPATPDAPAATEPPEVATEAPAPTSTAIDVVITQPTVEPSVTPPAESIEASPTPPTALFSSGPWLVINAGNGLWATNADGSGLTQLVNQKILSPAQNFNKALSPDGRHVAFVTADDATTYQGLKLNLLSLPEGTLETITPLFPADVVPFTGNNIGEPAFEAMRSIVDYDSMAWSPDGTRLAFISAQDGPSSDVYVYTLATGDVSRLTDGPSQAYGLSWSPDNRQIVHAGVSSFGTGAGYGLTGLWAVPDDGTPLKTLNTPSGGDVRVLGWIASNIFVLHDWNVQCGDSNLRFYNLDNDSERYIAPGCFASAVFNQASHALAFITLPDEAGGTRLGLHVVPPEGTEPIFIREDAKRVEWAERFGQFHVTLKDDSLVAYSAAGSELPYLTEDITGLPDGVPVTLKAWSPDQSTLAVMAGDTLYIVNAATMSAVPIPATNTPAITSIAWQVP